MFNGLDETEPTSEPKNFSWFKLVLVVLIAVLFGVDYGLYRANEKLKTAVAQQSAEIQTAKVALKKLSAPPLVAVAPASNVPAGPTAINVAGKREGGEHPLLRQLNAHPNLVDYPACHDKPAQQRAECNVQLLAVNTGIIDWKFGSEMRVRAADTTAFMIEKDAAGNLAIAVYAVSKTTHGDLSYSKTATYHAATTVAASHFIGPMDGTTVFRTPQLYMYAG